MEFRKEKTVTVSQMPKTAIKVKLNDEWHQVLKTIGYGFGMSLHDTVSLLVERGVAIEIVQTAMNQQYPPTEGNEPSVEVRKLIELTLTRIEPSYFLHNGSPKRERFENPDELMGYVTRCTQIKADYRIYMIPAVLHDYIKRTASHIGLTVSYRAFQLILAGLGFERRLDAIPGKDDAEGQVMRELVDRMAKFRVVSENDKLSVVPRGEKYWVFPRYADDDKLDPEVIIFKGNNGIGSTSPRPNPKHNPPAKEIDV